MDLMEYKARELFEKYGLRVMNGATVDSVDELKEKLGCIEYPAVVKAQVKIGGRGKAGGIKFADNDAELIENAEKILGMDIKGHIVKKLMIVKKSKIAKELYLSITLDRATKCPVIIFSPCGGMDIEAVAKETPEKIFKTQVNPTVGIKDYMARYLADKAGLDKEQTKELFDLLKNLYRMFCEYNCMLCEINPLAIDTEGHLLALDGKVTVDDSALMRLPDMAQYAKESDVKEDLVLEAEKYNFLFIPADPAGDIAVISNGSGMIMSCIDRITSKGMIVRSSLDLGGGATAERIKEAVRIILSDEKIKLLFINIFGGITRCDEVAGGIVMALDMYNIDKKIIVRFEGTNKDKGLEIIAGNPKVVYVPGLIEGVEELANEHFN